MLIHAIIRNGINTDKLKPWMIFQTIMTIANKQTTTHANISIVRSMMYNLLCI